MNKMSCDEKKGTNQIRNVERYMMIQIYQPSSEFQHAAVKLDVSYQIKFCESEVDGRM